METNEIQSDIDIGITPIVSKFTSGRAKPHTKVIQNLVVISDESDDSAYEDSNKSDINEEFCSENEQQLD